MTEQWLGWHFLRDDRRLRYRDGRRVNDGEIVEVGRTYEATGPLMLCANGMHASRRAVDALDYAPGSIVCRVVLEGEITEDANKAVARRRTVLWMLDATTILHEFACWCAEQELTSRRNKGQEPDPRSCAAIEAKRKWLRGEIGDEELAAASDAAWAAARAAAWDAARSATRVAACDAARTAAWDAAWAAAWAAGWGAAWAAASDAARSAARDKHNAELERLLFAAHDSEVALDATSEEAGNDACDPTLGGG